MHAKARRRSVAARSSAEAVPPAQTGRMLGHPPSFWGLQRLVREKPWGGERGWAGLRANVDTLSGCPVGRTGAEGQSARGAAGRSFLS